MAKELVRLNIRVSEEVQDYFKREGERLSVPYTILIAMRLTEIYENDKNKELVKEFIEALKSINTATGNVTAEEMMNQMKEMMLKFNELEK